VTQSQIQLALTIKAFVQGRMIGSAANGSWKNYCMVGEHMHNSNSFLNNFIKKDKFLLILQLDENPEFLGIS
jgi:hypothetical protein